MARSLSLAIFPVTPRCSCINSAIHRLEYIKHRCLVISKSVQTFSRAIAETFQISEISVDERFE